MLVLKHLFDRHERAARAGVPSIKSKKEADLMDRH